MSECDKMLAVGDKSQPIGEFLEWLIGQGLIICKFSDNHGEYIPHYEPIERLLARFFGIDLDKVEAEKRKILEDLRLGK